MRRSRFLTLCFGLCIAASALLYANSLTGQFMYDDEIFASRMDLRQPASLLHVWLEPFVVDNPGSGLYRPLTMFTFALQYQLLGESPVTFHALNILLHGLCSFLLLLIVLRLFDDRRLAVAAAALFLFLPIHTEAVASIKSRDELLSAAGVFAAWYCFLRARDSRRSAWWMATSALAFFCALLSKELIAPFPALFVVVWYLREHPRRSKVASVSLWYAAVFLLYLALRMLALGTAGFAGDDVYYVINPLKTADPITRFSTALSLLWIAISKTIVPWNLSATYHYNSLPLVPTPFSSWQSILGIGLIAGACWMLWTKQRRESLLGTGVLTFVIPYFLFSRIIFSHGDIFAERWLYAASGGICILLAAAFVQIAKRRAVLASTLFIATLVGYAAILVPRNAVWHDRLALGQSMIESAPGSIQGYVNVARHYVENGDLEHAAPAVRDGMAIYPHHPPLLAILGLLALQHGDTDIAIEAWKRAIDIRPEHDAVMLLAMTYAKTGKHEDSIDVLQTYFPNGMQQPDVRFLMAVNLYGMGQKEIALSLFNWDPSLTEAERETAIQQF